MPKKVMPEIPMESAIKRYEGGESLASLAREYGVSSTYLHQQFVDRGVRIRGRAEASRLRGPSGPRPSL
jgi:transposase-like protein